MKVIFEGVEIDFNEVIDTFDRIDSYTIEVLLKGYSSDGRIWQAYGVKCCDEFELENDADIEEIK